MTSVVVRENVGPTIVCVCVDGFSSRLAVRAVDVDSLFRFGRSCPQRVLLF